MSCLTKQELSFIGFVMFTTGQERVKLKTMNTFPEHNINNVERKLIIQCNNVYINLHSNEH